MTGILVLNAGNSSIKFELFDVAGEDLNAPLHRTDRRDRDGTGASQGQGAW